MYELTITKAFEVPVSVLFDAWTNPTTIQRWFAPGNMTVAEAQAEPQTGGCYRIVMHDPDTGDNHIVGGQYREVDENVKLVFSWQWEGSPNTTLVSITFKAIDNESSELLLHHSEFADQETCDKHAKGWNGCLANLHKVEATV